MRRSLVLVETAVVAATTPTMRTAAAATTAATTGITRTAALAASTVRGVTVIIAATVAISLLPAPRTLALAEVRPGTPSAHDAIQAGADGFDHGSAGPAHRAARTDTVSFGYYTIGAGGLPYAVLGETWTFDHGAADPLEGWTSRDLTTNDQAYWRQLTQTRWIAEGGVIPWPAMTGDGMVLCGATEGHADSLAWLLGRGYGNVWCQKLTSPPLVYDGTGTEELSLYYFSESELHYDYTKIWVESSLGSRVMINSPGFNGKIGIDTNTGVITPPGGVLYTKTISNLDLGGGTAERTIKIVIEFVSDGGLSDEDNAGPGADSFYGAVGMDNIGLSGANLVPPGPVSCGFETGLQGWTASTCPGVGSFMGVANRDDYAVIDPCSCALSGNVLEMHDAAGQHPHWQEEELSSPIVDRTVIPGNYLDYNRIIAEWNQYADMPWGNCVFYRPGWKYYPYENPHVPGLMQWSPRVGPETFYYSGDTPACVGPEPYGIGRNIGTDWGLPPNAQQVKFVYEFSGVCGFCPDACSPFSNFSPIIDNIRVRNVGFVNVPVCTFNDGTRFQDGFGQAPLGVLSTTDPGNSDIAYDLHRGSTASTKLGDSLVVQGPAPTSLASRWEAKLWFRLRRTGPGQTSGGNPGLARYNQWKAAIGPNVDYPDFAWGYMDSVESPAAQKNRFCSYFREGTPGYLWGGGTGDKSAGNEIMPDGVFTPGAKIEYFVTTNYLSTPGSCYVFPDTTGRAYEEFEILPSFRDTEDFDQFPCVLYVNAENSARYFVQQSLNAALNGLGPADRTPDPTTWDRYDYLDASSNWHGPLYRMGRDQWNFNGTGGATIPQLLGYKLIMIGLGDAGVGTMAQRDWQGLEVWLTAVACCGDLNLQGLIVDGIAAPQIIEEDGPNLLHGLLGATFSCASYNELGCAPGETTNDQQSCVKVVPVAGTPFGPGVATDVFGNWCPEKEAFNVLGVTGTGVGNKRFEKVLDGYQTSFAQVINDKSGGGSNYRSVIESFSYHRLTDVTGSTPGLGECILASPSADSAARVAAAAKEIENAVKWTLNLSDMQTQLTLCVDPCVTDRCGNSPAASEDGTGAASTRLYQNRPNPFNPRTAITFSLAADGPAKLLIYDVNGRRVRTLLDKSLKAGTHETVWDGTDDAGHTVSSGVYWSQLEVADYTSNRKMVVLK